MSFTFDRARYMASSRANCRAGSPRRPRTAILIHHRAQNKPNVGCSHERRSSLPSRCHRQETKTRLDGFNLHSWPL